MAEIKQYTIPEQHRPNAKEKHRNILRKYTTQELRNIKLQYTPTIYYHIILTNKTKPR